MVVASTKTTGGMQGKVNWQAPVSCMDLNCYPTKQFTFFKGFLCYRCLGAFNVYVYVYMYICVYTYLNICVYVYMCIYLFTPDVYPCTNQYRKYIK